MSARVVGPCAEVACPACPWRVSNRGRKGGPVENQRYTWYDPRNLRRLWAGLRNGERMTCHPTDPDHEGTPPTITETKECAGGTILVEREMMLFQHVYRDLRGYRRDRPKGLTRTGMIRIVESELFGAAKLAEAPMGRPDLGDPDIQHLPLGEFDFSRLIRHNVPGG